MKHSSRDYESAEKEKVDRFGFSSVEIDLCEVPRVQCPRFFTLVLFGTSVPFDH